MICFLQITITAALGFDSFLVMRHGAGPFVSSHDFNVEAANALSAVENIAQADKDERQRLGCYFCNDVVAPIDVIFKKARYTMFYMFYL